MNEPQYIFGLHAVRALLDRNPRQVRGLWFQQGRNDQRLKELQVRAGHEGIRYDLRERWELDELVPGAAHQGVVATVEVVRAAGEQELLKHVESLAGPAFLLILDGVQDPHNLGACLRSADAAAVSGVVIPKDRSCGMTPVVRKVACGAAETMPLFVVTNLARAMGQLKAAGVWLYGADQAAEATLYETDLTGPLALVMGAEGKGLRRLTRERCDRLLSIPMNGTVESLNVSVATGIVLFEARRQRGA